jgi:hypothetical protein
MLSFMVLISGIGADELRLCKASQFGDPLQMDVIVTRLAMGFSYTSRILHLEGEEVFGFVKRKKNLPLR